MHFFLSLYISVATPHMLILGATRAIAELVGSYQYLQMQRYLPRKNQFINTLKYFIESQDSKIDLLIIHIMQDGNFKFYDQYGIEIKDNNTEEMVSMIIKDDLNYEDFLISTLINLCPKRIEIIDDLRDEISEEIIENIKIIFENNVKVTFKQ